MGKETIELSVRDPIAQDLLWQYAERRFKDNPEFSQSLKATLISAGFSKNHPALIHIL